jgi:XTP/dITP diphosphohydrolase
VKLLAATRSAGKQREFKRVLLPAGIEVVFPDDVGLYPARAEDLLELGETFEANARRKAEHFIRLSGLPTVADDSGLEVLSLGGAPGVRSRRWAGASGSEAAVDAANNAELVRRLAGATGVRRGARYRCVLVYLATSGSVPRAFEGVCAGRILEDPRGECGFGYDPYFLSDELGKSFGEASLAEKDSVSHRGRALRELLVALEGAASPRFPLSS